MKKLSLIAPALCLLTFTLSLLVSCEEENDNLFDHTPMQIESPEEFAPISSDLNLRWTASARDDYSYDLLIAEMKTSEPTDVWTALRSNILFSQKGISTNRFAGDPSIQVQRGEYYAVLVVKRPENLDFGDFITSVPDDQLINYFDIRYFVSEGDLRIGTGCKSCCDTGSYTCPDGTVYECKCVNNFCWRKLCSLKTELEIIEFEG